MEILVVKRNDLISNINIIKEYVSKHAIKDTPDIIGVIKSNGYGLGLVELARILLENGINILAVSKANEAIKLRENEIDSSIILLSSTCIKEEIEELIKRDIILTIGSIKSLEIANEIAISQGKKINVHVKIETGFSRHGIRIDEINAFLETYKSCENIQIVGIFTHFINSFAKSSKLVSKQYDELMNAVEIFKLSGVEDLMVHICNSCAIFKYPQYYLNAVRVGSALTGRIQIPNEYGLKRVGQLQTKVSEIKDIKAGSNIGYANIYRVKKNTRIGIIQTGYSSGIGIDIKNYIWRLNDVLREIKHDLGYIFNKPHIYGTINEIKYPLIGNVRMNNVIIDITNSDVQIGDTVTLDIYPVVVDSNIERKYI